MAGSIWAILPAAGSGSRMKSAVKKQFLHLQSQPMLLRTLEAFEAHPRIDGIVIVTGEADIPEVTRMVDEQDFNKALKVVPGGATRQLSVYQGLLALPEDAGIVLIHDAARPILSQKLISACIDGVLQHGTAIAATPVKDTIKIASPDGLVTATPARDSLFAVQTPQAFRYQDILEAHRKAAAASCATLTDDGAVMEQFGSGPVYLIPGDYRNIKVTTPEDLMIAEGLLQQLKEEEA